MQSPISRLSSFPNNCTFSFIFFFSSRRRHTRFKCDWSSDVCSSDLPLPPATARAATLLTPRRSVASLGVSVSSQAVEQRFGAESAGLLHELLQEAVGEVLSSEASAPELLSRFTGVYVQDGTIISLPPELRDEWRGCGGSTPEAGQSSMRVQVRLDLAQGGMQGPWLQAGRAAEHTGEVPAAALPQGCLYNVVAGDFTFGEMRAHGP